MKGQRKRGFAAMSPEKQRAIARQGGQAAHSKGTAHEFSSEEARRAGHAGGKAVSANRAHMAAIGRKGGQRSVQESVVPRVQNQFPASSSATTDMGSHEKLSPYAVVNQLRAEHQRINGLFHQYEVGEQTQEARATVLKQICQALLKHSELEEDKVYPILQHTFAESEHQKIDSSRRVHDRIKELIRHIEERSLEADSVMMLVQELQTCVGTHVHEEEEELLPKAEECAGPELQQLAQELSPSVHEDMAIDQSNAPTS